MKKKSKTEIDFSSFSFQVCDVCCGLPHDEAQHDRHQGNVFSSYIYFLKNLILIYLCINYY